METFPVKKSTTNDKKHVPHLPFSINIKLVLWPPFKSSKYHFFSEAWFLKLFLEFTRIDLNTGCSLVIVFFFP